MNSRPKQALEHQPQFSFGCNASCQPAEHDSQTHSLRYTIPTRAGTLTPLMVRVAISTLLLLSGPPALAKRLRVMTYNIHVGVGMDKKLDLARIAGVINEQHPDLVGLQEVDRGVERTQRRDEIAELAKLTKMDYAFAFNLKYQGGQYGVAILSRYPIRSFDHRLYKNLREAERRGFIRAEVKIDGSVVNFVTTHLDYQYEDGRVFEAQQLLDGLKDVKGPLILVGDFNDVPAGGAYHLMQAGFVDSWTQSRKDDEGFSYPADKPAKRIDYIFFRATDRIRAKRTWIVTTLASDHVPVVADLELNGQNPRR
jgi:endonuclease/exonuclease/phosphatase family metal-dependent hydrolase